MLVMPLIGGWEDVKDLTQKHSRPLTSIIIEFILGIDWMTCIYNVLNIGRSTCSELEILKKNADKNSPDITDLAIMHLKIHVFI